MQVPNVIPHYKPKNHCQLNTRKLFHDNGIMTFKNPTVCTRRSNYNMVKLIVLYANYAVKRKY